MSASHGSAATRDPVEIRRARLELSSRLHRACSDLVRPSGFEPETCGLRVRCSAVELEAPWKSMTRPRAFRDLTHGTLGGPLVT
jgi:hypothetical protein